MKPRPESNKKHGKTKDRRLEINFWKQIVQGDIPPPFLSSTRDTRLCLEIFWHLVKSTILSWELNRGTVCISTREIENKVIHLLPIIYKYVNLLKSKTAYYTSLRKNSWLKRDYRLRRIFSEMKTDNYIHERDKNGDVIDSALRRPGTSNMSNPMESSVNPEGNLIEKEGNEVLGRILNRLGSCGRKYGPVYKKIMEMLLDGIDVGEEHADILGVPRKQVVTLKHQTRILARKIAAEEDPDVVEKINYLMNQMKKKRNLKKIIERLVSLFILCKDNKLEEFISPLIFNLMKNRSAKVMFR